MPLSIYVWYVVPTCGPDGRAPASAFFVCAEVSALDSAARFWAQTSSAPSIWQPNTPIHNLYACIVFIIDSVSPSILYPKQDIKVNATVSLFP